MIGLTSFDQYEDNTTDTVIYSFDKLVSLLLNCNPYTIEILGLDEEQYVIKTAIGLELLDQLRICEMFIPNREILDEFRSSTKGVEWKSVFRSFHLSQDLPNTAPEFKHHCEFPINVTLNR